MNECHQQKEVHSCCVLLSLLGNGLRLACWNNRTRVCATYGFKVVSKHFTSYDSRSNLNSAKRASLTLPIAGPRLAKGMPVARWCKVKENSSFEGNKLFRFAPTLSFCTFRQAEQFISLGFQEEKRRASLNNAAKSDSHRCTRSISLFAFLNQFVTGKQLTVWLCPYLWSGFIFCWKRKPIKRGLSERPLAYGYA